MTLWLLQMLFLLLLAGSVVWLAWLGWITRDDA